MKTLTLCTVAGALACAAPALAADASPSASVPSARTQCQDERAQMGAATFALTYGTNANRANAFGKCVSKRATATRKAGHTARANAAQACTAEQALDSAAFAAKYGKNANDKNAFGACVSTTARAAHVTAVANQTTGDVNAARSCKAQRTADREVFSARYGTGRNAFGRCVSTIAKA